MASDNKNTLKSIMDAVRENEHLIKGYSSRKCKDCLGRGYIEIKAPLDFDAKKYLCRCVEKRVKKEFEDDV